MGNRLARTPTSPCASSSPAAATRCSRLAPRATSRRCEAPVTSAAAPNATDSASSSACAGCAPVARCTAPRCSAWWSCPKRGCSPEASVSRLGWPGGQAMEIDADGHATALRELGTMVLVADCLPVILGSEGAVAAVHAGWRGLAGGVLEEGVRAVRELGGSGEHRRRHRPRRARLLLRGRRGGAPHVRQRPPRGAQPRPRGGCPRSPGGCRGDAHRGRRGVHDLRRAPLLPPPRRARGGPPGGDRVARRADAC